jgi:ATP-dependent Clp protease protease subunit
MASRKLSPKRSKLKEDEHRIAALHDYSLDVDTRCIYLTDEIEGYSCSEFVKDLHYLESKDSKKPIKIFVNSPGGSVDQMFFVYDAMKACSCPVVTIGTGGIYSAAGLILVSGDLRIATPNSFFMAHQMQNLIAGADNEIEAQVAIGRKFRNKFWEIMGKHTKVAADVWAKQATTKGEIWYDAKEMLQKGIVDHVLNVPETIEQAVVQFEFDSAKRIS